MTFQSLSKIERIALAGVLAAFVILGVVYSIATPLFEASDELWHYPMVKTLADGNGLPVQDAANPGPWRQEGSQPPLYYAVIAASTFWIDTSDIDEVRRLNPHADNGIITADGNNNLIVHNAQKEAWPWQGTALAVHIGRILSVLMGIGTVLFTYLIGAEVFPRQRWLGIGAAAVTAFTPMFLFISGSINNDNLGVLASTVVVWILLKVIGQVEANRPTLRWAAALGVVLGTAALSKQSALGSFALSGLVMAYAAWRSKRWQTLFVEGPLAVGIALAIAGWWYWRNWMLYQDPTGLNVFLDIVGRRSPPASLAQLWGERVGFMESYWGLFGGVSIPMADWVYTLLTALASLSAIGAIVFVIKWVRREKFNIGDWAPVLVTLLWIPGVVLPLVFGWTRFTVASQGRLIFSAISCVSLWMITGLCGWLPERAGKIAAVGVSGLMFVLAAITPFVWIAPRYAAPPPLAAEQESQIADFLSPDSGEPAMRLAKVDVTPAEVAPEGSVTVTLDWQVLSPMTRNWSVFVHLQDSAGLIVAQRDVYPGMGLLATSDLATGRTWRDRVVIPIPASAYAPEELTPLIGLYDLQTGERMATLDGTDSVTLQPIRLTPRVSSNGIPNPVSFDFGGEIELVGYQVGARLVKPGETVELTTYWNALQLPKHDYTLSVQILTQQFDKLGQADAPLSKFGASTKSWTAGKVAEQRTSVILSDSAPFGTHQLVLIVYWVDDGGEIQRLQLVHGDQIGDPNLSLTAIKVLP